LGELQENEWWNRWRLLLADDASHRRRISELEELLVEVRREIRWKQLVKRMATVYAEHEEVRTIRAKLNLASPTTDEVTLAFLRKGPASQTKNNIGEVIMLKLHKGLHGQSPKLPSFVHTLTDMYNLDFWFWEVIECVRKMVFVGLSFLVGYGSVGQLMFGLTISVLFIVTYNYLSPYDTFGNNILQQLCQLNIFAQLLAATVLRYYKTIDTPIESAVRYESAGWILVGLALVTMVWAIYALRYDSTKTANAPKESKSLTLRNRMSLGVAVLRIGLRRLLSATTLLIGRCKDAYMYCKLSWRQRANAKRNSDEVVRSASQGIDSCSVSRELPRVFFRRRRAEERGQQGSVPVPVHRHRQSFSDTI
jgi:hypothetical protein